jgi:hypothetical protein
MDYDFKTQFSYYASLVTEADLIEALSNSLHELGEVFDSIGNKDLNYAYEPGKWTIYQLIQHLIDTERIFQFRALAIARGDKTELPGYDHEAYAEMSLHKTSPLNELQEELSLLRESSIRLFSSLGEKDLDLIGTANKLQIKARDIGFLIVGHQRHHLRILEERY